MRPPSRTPLLACSVAVLAAVAASSFAPSAVSTLVTGDAPVRRAPGRPAAVVEDGIPKERLASPRARVRTDRSEAAAPEAPTQQAPGDRLALFRGLGAWIDLYDMALDPRATVRMLKANDVRTLYIQTARSNTPYAIHPGVGPWLEAAHAEGIAVVGWYLPYYKNMKRDHRRMVAIARYSWRGHRFDGAGIDIEFRGAVKSLRRWNSRVAANAASVRRELGPRYPLAGIPPTPLQMRVAPGHWAGFPWASLARSTDATLLMSYWSDRIGCPRMPLHCAYEFTRYNVEITRRLQGEKQLVHVIGGIGDQITATELRDFVRGAVDSGADGASIYDVVTTKRRWWRSLRPLRILR